MIQNDAEFLADLAERKEATLDLCMGAESVRVGIPLAPLRLLFDAGQEHNAAFVILQSFIRPALRQLIDARFPELMTAAIDKVRTDLEARQAAAATPTPGEPTTTAEAETTDA